MRLLFVFDPQRRVVFLVGGDKSGKWFEWYKQPYRKQKKPTASI